MAGEATFEGLNGLSRKVYDNTVKNSLPESAVLQRLFPLSTNKRLGDTYEQAVVLQLPNGITYEGSAGSVNDLVNPSGMVIKSASLAPFATTLREQVAIAALSRLQEKGEGVIASHIGQMMLAMKKSIVNRVEASLLRGQSASGCGVVQSVTGTDAVHADVVFSEASFSRGLFHFFGPGSKWATWQAGGTVRKNTDGAITLQRIDAKTRTVRFLITGTVASNFVATDVLFPYSARTGASAYNEAKGLVAQASNTTGVSLGIDAGSYPVWAGNVANVGGPLTFGGLEEYLSELRDRGAEEKLIFLCSNRLYSALSAELQAMRVIDSSYTSGKQRVGMKAVQYTSKDVGDIEIIAHPFMVLGEGLILPEADVERVGSSDVTFGIPGAESGEFWQRVPNRSAAELQCFTDQSILLRAPSHSYSLTGITY